METKKLCNLLEEIRISSYLNLPIIENDKSRVFEHGVLCNICGSEFKRGGTVIVDGNEIHACRQCIGHKEAKNKKELIKNFKVNYKTLDDYFSDENTKNRLAERVNQVIAFSNEGLKYKGMFAGILASFFGQVMGPFTWVHEMGHVAAANLVYSNVNMTIQVDFLDNFNAFWNNPSLGTFLNLFGHNEDGGALGYAFLNGSTDLSDFGNKIGEQASRGLFLGGGVMFESLFIAGLGWTGLLAYALGKKELGSGLMAFSAISQIQPTLYAMIGSENIYAAKCFGMSSPEFATLISAPLGIAIGLAYLKHKLDERKKKKRENIKFLIDKQKISPDELFESFQDYYKNIKITSLEKELSSKAKWLFYCEKKEQNKVTKNINNIAMKLFKNYTGFVDFLGIKYDNRIKEQEKIWKEKTEEINDKDFTLFKDELCNLGVHEEKTKKIYDMLHKKYGDFCVENKEYKVAEKFMKKTGFSKNDFSLEKVVSALRNFYEEGTLTLSERF